MKNGNMSKKEVMQSMEALYSLMGKMVNDLREIHAGYLEEMKDPLTPNWLKCVRYGACVSIESEIAQLMSWIDDKPHFLHDMMDINLVRPLTEEKAVTDDDIVTLKRWIQVNNGDEPSDDWMYPMEA